MISIRKSTIGDVCSRFSSGTSIKPEDVHENGRYPVYGGNGLRGYTDSYNFEGECAIIGRQGAYCGNVRYFKGKAFMTEHAIVVVPNEKNVAGYLALKFSLIDLKRYQGQSAQPGLSVKTLTEVDIDLPDKCTQEKVFAVINSIDSKIEVNNKIISELESMAKTIYDYWFLQFDFPDENGKPYKSSGGKMVWNEELKREIPEGWTCYSIKDIFDVNKYGIGSFEQYDYVNYLDTSNLTRNLIGEYDKIISKEDLPSRAKRKINKNDVLFSVVRPNQEHFGIIKFPVENMIASTGFAVLSSKKVYINDILYLFLTSKDILDKLIKIADSSASSYPAINADDIMELKIALPMDERFKEFLNKKFDSVFTTVHLKNMENKELASLRDWLLPMLMNGQVTFKDEK